jgi:hypothetical protein
MFVIEETIIDQNVFGERFACDLARCKGACCTLPGGRGAPLDDSEVEEIRRAFPAASRYLSPDHKKVIEAQGMVEGCEGSYATVCVNDRACVFAYDENGVARCSLEKAYLEGATGWRKPLSCHLFPLRVSSRNPSRIRYEEISECSPGRARGTKEGIPLFVFLKEALVRRFGMEWYEKAREAFVASQDITAGGDRAKSVAG